MLICIADDNNLEVSPKYARIVTKVVAVILFCLVGEGLLNVSFLDFGSHS